MVEKDELLAVDLKTLAGVIVNKGYMEDLLKELVNPYAQAVLDAPSPEKTVFFKNRYDAVVSFGHEILQRLNLDADMVPPPAMNIQLDS